MQTVTMNQARIETPAGTVEVGVADGALVSLYFVDDSDAPTELPAGDDPNGVLALRS